MVDYELPITLPNNVRIEKITSKVKDRVGMVIDRLEVVSFIGFQYYENSNRQSYWLCKCKCGNYSGLVGTTLNERNIAGGMSCGCFSKEQSAKRLTENKAALIHGLSSHPLYTVWYSIYKRCCITSDSAYESYGGRGITLCDEWMYPAKHGFINFLGDLGERPEGMTVERVDNSKGYSKSNCEWKTVYEQSLNRRDNQKYPNTYENLNGGRYRASLRYKKKYYFLGMYDTREEAFKVAMKFRIDNSIPTPERILELYRSIDDPLAI